MSNPCQSQNMSISYNFGKEAEKFAQNYLKSKNYKILDTNWRYSRLEVDIIAKKNDFIIIVEVKARKNLDLNFDEIISDRKQKNLINAAEKYLDKKDLDCEVRFDVIFISKTNNKFYANHIENAFYSTID